MPRRNPSSLDRTVLFNAQMLETVEIGDGNLLLRKVDKMETVSLKTAAAVTPNLSIAFDGPVAIIDPPQAPPADQPREEAVPQPALRYRAGALAGFETALRQFLRQRSGWLEVTAHWNSRNLLDDPRRVVRKKEEIDGLTSTQRLFGVTGFRGLLSLHVFEAADAGTRRFPGIALDALTQAVLHGRTFIIDAATGVQVQALVCVDHARHRRAVSRRRQTDDLALLARLVEDVRENGMRIGRRSVAGFGWSSRIDLHLASRGAEEDRA